MKRPQTVKSLEELGRVRLSKNFFMRDFLHSEISQIEGIPNIPNNPDLAIASGKNLQMFYAWIDTVVYPSILSALSLPQKTLFPHGALNAGDHAVLPLLIQEL